MVRKFRQAHLWIGLISSILLFLEAGTGLLLSEPWLLGQPSGERFERWERVPPDQIRDQSATQGNTQGGIEDGTQNPSSGSVLSDNLPNERFRFSDNLGGRMGNSFLGIVRGVHEGRIGNVDIRWLIDLSAVSILFLTATGIYLSIKTLRTQRKAHAKKEVAQS